MRSYWLAAAAAFGCAQIGFAGQADAQSGLPAASPAQTLPEALAQAYESNPTIGAARAQARSADEAIIQARAGYLPQVEISSVYTARDIEAESRTGVVTRTDFPTSFTALEVTQPLFTGFRRRGQTQSARASADSAAAAARQVEQSVLLQAVAAYVDVRRDTDVVRIRGNNVEVLAKQLQAARDRFQVGEITRTDVAQAEARLAQAQAGLAVAQADLEATKARYTEIIGAPPESLAAPPPAPALPASLDEAFEQTERASPALARLLANERAARARVRIERSELLPQVNFVGTASRQEEFPFHRNETDSLTAATQVSVPLFEGGFNWSRIRQARIDAQRSSLQTEEIRRTLRSEVTAAWNDYQAALRVIESSRQQERAAALAFEGAQEELSVGLRTTLDVLNAQQEALEAQLAVIRAERDAYVAAHGLLASIGALTPEALNINVSLYDPRDHRRAVRWKVIGAGPVD